MDSPIRSYRIVPRPDENTSWSVNFIGTDSLTRKIILSGYIDAANHEGLVLTIPALTTSTCIGSMPQFKPLHHNAILEITHGNDAAASVTRRTTRLSSSYRDQFAQITDGLYTFGVTKENYVAILKDISGYLNQNCRIKGGEIDVEVLRSRVQVLRRHEDRGVDAYVETLFRGNMASGPKAMPADASAIDSLESFRFSPECAICIEDFEDGSVITRLPCHHVFHGDCVKNWLQINHVCPLCRKQID